MAAATTQAATVATTSAWHKKKHHNERSNKNRNGKSTRKKSGTDGGKSQGNKHKDGAGGSRKISINVSSTPEHGKRHRHGGGSSSSSSREDYGVSLFSLDSDESSDSSGSGSSGSASAEIGSLSLRRRLRSRSSDSSDDSSSSKKSGAWSRIASKLKLSGESKGSRSRRWRISTNLRIMPKIETSHSIVAGKHRSTTLDPDPPVTRGAGEEATQATYWTTSSRPSPRTQGTPPTSRTTQSLSWRRSCPSSERAGNPAAS